VLAEPEYVDVPAGFPKPGIVSSAVRGQACRPDAQDDSWWDCHLSHGGASFTDKQIELVTNFAAGLSSRSARLLNELRARTNGSAIGQRIAGLGEVSQTVNSTLDLETVLTTIVGRAVQLSRTDAGTIYVFDDERKEFHLRATYGMSEAMIAAIADQHIGLGL
jgi:hypothetical protein